MDLEYLVRLVQNDDTGLYPSAEYALRLQMGVGSEPMNYPALRSRVCTMHVAHISDPQGLLRSLDNMRSGPGEASRYHHNRHWFRRGE